MSGATLRQHYILGENGMVISTDNRFPVESEPRGAESLVNSTIIPLLAGATFTGEAENVINYAAISIIVKADQDSAAEGLVVEFSSDSSDWHPGEEYTVNADETKFFTPPVQSKYFRVSYTNGAVDQTYFHLHTVLKSAPVKWSSHNINKPITGEDDAGLVKAVVTGQRDDGLFSNCTLSNSDRLRVVNQPYSWAVSEGDIAGHRGGTAKGERGPLAIVTTGSDVWRGTAASIPIPPDAGDLMSIVSTSTQDILTTGTGIWSVVISYIDAATGAESTLEVDMNGTTVVDTGILMRYVNRIASKEAGTTGSSVGAITIFKTGTPTTVYREIGIGSNTDLGCDFMVPGGYSMYLTEWKCSVAGAGKPCAMRFRATINEKTGLITPRLFHSLDTEYLETGRGGGKFDFPVKIPSYAIVKVTAYATQAGPYVAAGFAGWMETI